jgi:hypothetical protein
MALAKAGIPRKAVVHAVAKVVAPSTGFQPTISEWSEPATVLVVRGDKGVSH